MKSKSLILLLLSIGFGIVAAIGISQVMNGKAIANPTETPRGPVLLASIDLDLNEELTEENVKLENWVVDTIPPDAVTSLDEITDMVTTTRMYPGMPIVRGAIQHKNTSFNRPIPENMKVVAVRVRADDTIGNLLNPGDKVDVIGIFKQRDRTTNHTTTNSRTFLKALEVYSIGNKTRIDNTDNPNGNSNATSIVGLLVSEKQSEALVFVQDTGSIKLVLRGDDVENDGEVGQLEELESELLAGAIDLDASPVSKNKMNTVMEIYLGSESRVTKFDDNGSRIREEESQGSGTVSGGSGLEQEENLSDDPSDGDYADSAGQGSSDRGIDDDQYRGQ